MHMAALLKALMKNLSAKSSSPRSIIKLPAHCPAVKPSRPGMAGKSGCNVEVLSASTQLGTGWELHPDMFALMHANLIGEVMNIGFAILGTKTESRYVLS